MNAFDAEFRQMNRRPVVAAFDFDGTISWRDTFAPFLVRAFGWEGLIAASLRSASAFLGYAVGRCHRDELKDRLVRALFTGRRVSDLTLIGRLYAEEVLTSLRPGAIERIRWHRAAGHRLVMVSASLDLYLVPIAEALGFDDLLSSRVSHDGEAFNGGLAGGNCRGQGKVDRLHSLLGDLVRVELYAYGDSAGDAEMLAVADHPNLRPFRNER